VNDLEIRKLVKAGHASHTLSLPKSWLDKNKLKKGDVLYVIEKSDTELSVTPKIKDEKAPKKEITINIDRKEFGTIQREVTSAYLNNYSTINIIGDEVARKTKDIREMLHSFIALEIAEQTSTKVVAKDLLDLKEISIEKTVRRMDMIIRSIIQDSIQSLDGKNISESIHYRDVDVNRLYFMLSRLLKSALANKSVADNFGIKNDDVLSSWYLILCLENIADNGKNISELFNKIKNVDKKELVGIYKGLEESYTEVMKAYFSKNKRTADDVASRRIKIFDGCKAFLKKHNTADAAELMENFKELKTNICNIARIVIDQE
jgi:phosphate uptake regulator